MSDPNEVVTTVISEASAVVAPLNRNEARLRLVAILSAVVMLVEVTVGFWTGSLALIADGFHMFAHVGALSVAAFAFWYVRTQAPERFVLGSGKVHALAAFANGALLLAIALLTLVEAIERLIDPQPIRFLQAIAVATVGLGFNLFSMFAVGDGQHRHAHDHSHDHGHKHGGAGGDNCRHDHAEDQNVRAAYLHLLGDAITSIGAIAALLAGKYLGLRFADPLVAILACAVVARWGYGLCRSTARFLVDARDESGRAEELVTALRTAELPVADLTLWEVAANQYAVIVTMAGPSDEIGGLTGAIEAALRKELTIRHLAFRLRGPARGQ